MLAKHEFNPVQKWALGFDESRLQDLGSRVLAVTPEEARQGAEAFDKIAAEHPDNEIWQTLCRFLNALFSQRAAGYDRFDVAQMREAIR